MAEEQKMQRVERRLTDEERARGEVIREGAMRDFPPKEIAPPPAGIPRRVHDARKQRGMTRAQLSKLAEVPDTAVLAIERGEDVAMSQFNAVIAALGLTMELVEHA